MENKGFTIVEMLGIVTLLAVIFALIYPNAIEMLDRGKTSEYNRYKDTIILAAESYVNADTTKSFPNVCGNKIEDLTYEILIINGYLSSNVLNPNTNETVGTNSSNKKIIIEYDCTDSINNKIKYTLHE